MGNFTESLNRPSLSKGVGNMSNPKFKVGDVIIVLDCFDGGTSDYIGKQYTIISVETRRLYKNNIITAYHFDPFWAEEHEIRLITPLDKLL